MKPQDRIPDWPEQAACMRVQRCTDLLSRIIPEGLWLEVRTAVARWEVENDPESQRVLSCRAVRLRQLGTKL